MPHRGAGEWINCAYDVWGGKKNPDRDKRGLSETCEKTASTQHADRSMNNDISKRREENKVTKRRREELAMGTKGVAQW